MFTLSFLYSPLHSYTVTTFLTYYIMYITVYCSHLCCQLNPEELLLDLDGLGKDLGQGSAAEPVGGGVRGEKAAAQQLPGQHVGCTQHSIM
jgi:hypothetical protein